ncbi:unnamed protein product [Nippostrongylus brasiliensis]|uniref:DUF190 domain-containing protein n=1 Tax=Nippostrongylus brasiliensis TaxID=27835 RepID=A0A0N4Y4W0_NIPBR|nr:unnamed protein product [Nippostrongylus brasiliensis]
MSALLTYQQTVCGLAEWKKFMTKLAKACSVGLQAIVADGVHTPQPKELGRHSQLYCVHVSMERAGHSNDGEGLRIVLDFEKAAINAAKSLLPKAKIHEVHVAHWPVQGPVEQVENIHASHY